MERRDEEDPRVYSETARLLLPGEKASSSIQDEDRGRAAEVSTCSVSSTVGTSSSNSSRSCSHAHDGIEEHESSVGPTPRSNALVRKAAAHPMASLRGQKMVPVDEDPDLEAGSEETQPQCRICLESDAGRDFIAPCRCKGSSQFVHRECLDQWRSIKEGFAFAHCTTCKMRYHIRVQVQQDAKWRTAKFRFFVTRDALAVTLLVQALIIMFGFMIYSVDAGLASGKLMVSCGFTSAMAFYYLCGLVAFFFMAGMLGCVFTCIDPRFRSDIGGPCREICTCCCHPLVWGDCHCCSPLCFYADCSGCAHCAGASTECLTAGGLGEAGAMIFVTVGLVALVVFAVVGIFYSLVVAAVVAQRIWQRHYHILAKRMLAKEYVVEDLAGQDLSSNYAPPPLPPEHEKQLKDLGLLP